MGTDLLFILTLLGVFPKSFVLYPWKCCQNIKYYCDKKVIIVYMPAENHILNS